MRQSQRYNGTSTPQGEPLRFINEVAAPYASDDCLTWPYSMNGKGYGKLRFGGSKVYAHRLVCWVVHGAPPSPEHEAAHSCGKGHLGCVNPRHLEWKTRAGNHADKLIHGTDARGERNKAAKLSEAQAKQVLRLKGHQTTTEIASAFGVCRKTVERIHSRETWSWLEVEAV